MPCLFVLIALIAPRILALVLWFFTNWFNGIFDSLLWPVLGFVFAPTTLLWYTVVVNAYGGVWSAVPIIGMVIAVAIDLSPASGKRD